MATTTKPKTVGTDAELRAAIIDAVEASVDHVLVDEPSGVIFFEVDGHVRQVHIDVSPPTWPATTPPATPAAATTTPVPAAEPVVRVGGRPRGPRIDAPTDAERATAATALDKAIIERRLANRSLAEALGRSDQTVANYRHGRSYPDAATQKAIEEYLGVDAGSIFPTRKPEPEPEKPAKKKAAKKTVKKAAARGGRKAPKKRPSGRPRSEAAAKRAAEGGNNLTKLLDATDMSVYDLAAHVAKTENKGKPDTSAIRKYARGTKTPMPERRKIIADALNTTAEKIWP